MYNLRKKIEYSVIKMLYEDLDIYIDQQYNTKFTKENNSISVDLGLKVNYQLNFDKIFNVKHIDNCTYVFSTQTNIEDIINKDDDNLFVCRYNNHLQTLEKVLLYLCIDNDNKYMYDEYKSLLRQTIQQLV